MERNTYRVTQPRGDSLVSCIISEDEEAMVKALRGMADVKAGRVSPASEVRDRLMSRYCAAGVAL
jgi:predicted transcriptional regulator